MGMDGDYTSTYVKMKYNASGALLYIVQPDSALLFMSAYRVISSYVSTTYLLSSLSSQSPFEGGHHQEVRS
jgi:hypothetical protein